MIHGMWQPVEARIWTTAMILPLAKGDDCAGCKLRPIALCEALLKPAEGVLMDAVGERVRAWA